ncbi:heme peroxidase [Mycena floridula]|nr:heme peroxidase [Mycena floridula]
MSFARAFRSARKTSVQFRQIPSSNFRSSFRRFSTEPPKESGNSAIFMGLGAVGVAAGISYWMWTSAQSSSSPIFKPKVNFVATQEDYQKVYNKIAEMFDEASDANYDDGSYAPVILRLAWHASGTYDETTKTGGSNYATMRFAPESLHGANAGRFPSLNTPQILIALQDNKLDWISYGDLWTLAGVAAVQEMAGPQVPWRPGRVDGIETHVTPDGRLPDATQGADHLRQIFGPGRMGFSDQEIVALSGAHALGRCHSTRSGFEGPWTFSPTTVTNDYFKLLFSESWVWKKWNGPKQLEDKKTKTLMMLPTDYVLVQDKSFKKYAKAYAKDNELFFKDFSAVVAKLFELGVPADQWVSPEPWVMKTLDEQK